jgi:hypothetical protein
MGEHTKGPWEVVDYSDHTDSREILVIHRDSESRVCFMATPGSNGDAKKIAADARLIAAAPDLLAAAKAALNFIANTEGELGITLNSGDLLRAALSKASGRAPTNKEE